MWAVYCQRVLGNTIHPLPGVGVRRRQLVWALVCHKKCDLKQTPSFNQTPITWWVIDDPCSRHLFKEAFSLSVRVMKLCCRVAGTDPAMQNQQMCLKQRNRQVKYVRLGNYFLRTPVDAAQTKSARTNKQVQLTYDAMCKFSMYIF